MSFDSSCGFLFNHLHYYGGCQYAKDTTLIAVCVVEFSGLHSNFLVCKLQCFTVNLSFAHLNVCTICVYLFTKLFWQPQLPKFIFSQCRKGINKNGGRENKMKIKYQKLSQVKKMDRKKDM